MAETYTAVLPNGRKLPKVPMSATPAEIQDVAIRGGLATIEDFNTTPTNVTEATQDPWYEGASDFVQENMDIPMSITLGVAGAKIGAVGGPVGSAVLGTLGSAVGAFSGTLISDVLTGEDLDFGKAIENVLIGGGIDIAMLALPAPLKASFFITRRALGFSPKEVAEEIIANSGKVADAGTIESLRATQKILEKQGASLSRYQTGNASALEVFGEKLGQAGVVSGREAAENIEKVNTAAQTTLNDLFGAVDIRTGASPAELGAGLYDVINAGKQALSQVYGEGLEEISSKVANNVVNTKGISKKLQNFLASKQEKTFGIVGGKEKTKLISTLDPEAAKFIKEQLSGALELGNMSAQSLLKVDKLITQQLRKFGDIKSPSYNSVADAQLGEMQDILKTAFIDTLKQADPKAAEAYRLLKLSYKEGSSGLLPVINKNTIQNADAGNFDVLGNLLTTQTNISKISAMMSSIDEAYVQLGKVKGLPSEIPYATAKEAKQAIKQSFLKNLMPNLNAAQFDIKEYASLASQFSTPAGNKRLQVILGKDYAPVKQVFNLFTEASKRPEGNFGTLFLRGKEFATVGAAVGGTAVGGPLLGMGSAAAVLMAPVFLAKAAVNPKAVNKLLAFDKMTFKNDVFKEKALTLIISDVLNGLTKEEQAELRNGIREQYNLGD
tara:strand:- start:1797 stop:3800 length:2004 start_codon:yes stop_codon:yes gene_type:complete